MDTEVENNTNNLTDWENPPTLQDLRKDYEEARSVHDEHCKTVDRWLDALRGKANFKPREGRSKVQPKLVRKQNEWRYAAMEEPFLSTDDMFVVNPATYQDVEPARQNMLVLNKQFRVDIPKIKFINKYIRSAVNTGTAIMKLSWEVKTDKVRDEVPVYTKSPEETAMVLQQMMQQGQIDEQTAAQMMQSGQPIQIGVEPKMVEREVINRPVIEVKDSRNVIIDPSCEGDLDKAKFVIDRFVTDMSTLKEDGRYSNLDRINPENISNDTYYTDYEADYSTRMEFAFADKPRKKLIAYEYWGYWDIHNKGIVEPIVVTWVGNTIIRMEENPYPDKKVPFVIVQYLPPDTNSIYGDSDASLLEDNQQIIGAVTRSIIDLVGRSANAQQGIRKDLLDPINLDRFKKGLDFEYNPVNNVDGAIYMTKLPEIPKSAVDIIMLQNNEAEALTGVKAFSTGISGNALGDKATGIRSALDATAKRELGILRRLSQGLIEAGRKIMAMNSVWLSDEEIIRITDDEFVAIKRSDLAGNFDLQLTVSTAEVDNQKASELAFMLQTMGNSVPFDLTKMILVKIAELRKLPDLAKALQDYQPQPDPMQQKAAELQIAMLEAQVENERAKGMENQADIVLKKAKAETEMAKAGKTSSEKDKLDLDFMEQATGLNHRREMEKQKSQEEASLKQAALDNEVALTKAQMDNDDKLLIANMQARAKAKEKKESSNKK